MSEIVANQTPPITINSQNTYNFGNGGSGEVSTTVLSMVSSSFSGSITVVGRPQGTTAAFVSIPYTSRYLNGAASDDSSKTTAITGTSIVEVDSTGLDIGLDVSSYTSGSMSVSVTRATG